MAMLYRLTVFYPFELVSGKYETDDKETSFSIDAHTGMAKGI